MTDQRARLTDCPGCGESLIDAEFEVERHGHGWMVGAYVYPTWASGWDRFLGVLGAERARVSDQPTKVCPGCGLTVLFVDDPAPLRQEASRDQPDG